MSAPESNTAPSDASKTAPSSGAPRTALFRFLSAGFALGLTLTLLGIVEAVLRRQERSIRQSDQLQAGLVQHDPLLGWTLTPGASGEHRHHDYHTQYRINEAGFRFDPAVQAIGGAVPREAIVGDSFTFGLGVRDNETFVSLLNTQRGTNTLFINCGVPGYSTDQEILITQRDVVKLKPVRIWLAVCLVNDLVDNLHPYPMQANRQKPYFQLSGNQLALENVPVSKDPVSPGMRRLDLLGEILGPDFRQHGWTSSLEGRSILVRILTENLFSPPDVSGLLPEKNQRSVELFSALTLSLLERLKAQGMDLGLILIPGRSRVLSPQSISGQYQRFLETQLAAFATKHSMRAITLSDGLGKVTSKAELFFPHDGHFTTQGNQAVATILAEQLRNP